MSHATKNNTINPKIPVKICFSLRSMLDIIEFKGEGVGKTLFKTKAK
jgi:hypothetical protein